jgi:hypothetical protein
MIRPPDLTFRDAMNHRGKENGDFTERQWVQSSLEALWIMPWRGRTISQWYGKRSGKSKVQREVMILLGV